MHKNTKDIRNHICSTFDDSYDRVSYFKNKYVGETAYILASGPSFGYYDSEFLKEFLKDKFVISIKQTYETMAEVSDIHLINFCNLSSYDYSKNENTIVGWTVWDSIQPHQIINSQVRCDFILDTYKLGDGSANINNTVAVSRDYNLLSLDYRMARPWGPGMMYELAIPLAIYAGCNKIVTIGWDLFSNTVKKYKSDDESMLQDHFFNNITYDSTKTYVSKKEIMSVIDSTKSFNEWLLSCGVSLEIVDPYNENPADVSITKIQL